MLQAVREMCKLGRIVVLGIVSARLRTFGVRQGIMRLRWTILHSSLGRIEFYT